MNQQEIEQRAILAISQILNNLEDSSLVQEQGGSIISILEEYKVDMTLDVVRGFGGKTTFAVVERVTKGFKNAST